MKISQDKKNYYVNSKCIPKDARIGNTEDDHNIWYVSHLCRDHFEQLKHTKKMLKRYGY